MRLFNHVMFTSIVMAVGTTVAPGVYAKDAAPRAADLLTWKPEQQVYGYQNMEKIFPVHIVRRGTSVRPLPASKQTIHPTYTFGSEAGGIADYIKYNRVGGLLIIHDGKILVERYALGYSPAKRWTSFSIAKSITSTLIGAAIADGYISSVDEPLMKYVPGLKGSAYDGVSIAQALEMRSGVAWNEDYEDPKSDVSRMISSMANNRGDSLIDMMKTIPREAPPGTKFSYKTGESNLIGVIVRNATHKSLAQYLSEKIWAPYGMERDAVWITDGGTEVGGACISMTLRDYGRFGMFVMDNGVIGGKKTLPDHWIQSATKLYTQHAFGDIGYGYQWWPHADGSYEGIGIFGQSLFVDPASRTVIVTSSAWPHADDETGYRRQAAFRASVMKAIAALPHTPST